MIGTRQRRPPSLITKRKKLYVIILDCLPGNFEDH